MLHSAWKEIILRIAENASSASTDAGEPLQNLTNEQSDIQANHFSEILFQNLFYPGSVPVLDQKMRKIEQFQAGDQVGGRKSWAFLPDQNKFISEVANHDEFSALEISYIILIVFLE